MTTTAITAFPITTHPLVRRLGALVLGLGLLTPAWAGLFDDDEARRAILDLRQRIEAARQATDAAAQRAAADNTQLRNGLLDLQNQIELLRSDLARLRGQNEQLARDLADQQKRLADLRQNTDERLHKFEPATVTLDGREFQADPAEVREYQAALAAFRAGQFDQAQSAFLEFTKRYPKSGYGPLALFWLGNAQYATRNYKEAIANFRAMLTRDPDHPRVPEAMLSIANCQLELKDTKAARKTLDDLIKTYPQSEAAAAARQRIAKLK